MGHFLGFFAQAQDNFEVKRSWPPRKTPRNAPLYVLPAKKKIISRTFKISGTLIAKYSQGFFGGSLLIYISTVFKKRAFPKAGVYPG
jgi:hypothetical protein